MSIKAILTEQARQAMIEVGLDQSAEPHLALSQRSGCGDYQINGAMAQAKKVGIPPRELAQKIQAAMTTGDIDMMCEKIEIAGPGFINLWLKSSWISKQLNKLADDSRLGVAKTINPQVVVVDYSSPNLAKEMHVGHLRGTIIGDAVVRVLDFLGHKVIRQNHIGDWGTQFGMLIAELEEHQRGSGDANNNERDHFELGDLEAFYRQAKAHFDADPEFAERARDYVVRLQGGDARCLELWQQFIDASLRHSEEIYRKLGVCLQPDDIRGESAYNSDLPQVVETLSQMGLAQQDQGAQVVFHPELADKKGQIPPVIVQKADGGYLYATTDLAALKYRAGVLNADRCLYFIDARQSLHMKQVFLTAEKAGWVDAVKLEHCAYGTMMGTDGKPFKTRSGDTVKLSELLDEAVTRARVLVDANADPEMDDQERDQIAHAVGVGAVKYADLSKTRTNDYIFDWDQMLSLDGNTAPYLQYAVARIHSLLRKATVDGFPLTAECKINIDHNSERSLAMALLQFEDIVNQVGEKAMPHELCHYAFDLSGRFMSFYEACPVLKDGVGNEVRMSRLKLAWLTAQTLSNCLQLLGIDALERM